MDAWRVLLQRLTHDVSRRSGRELPPRLALAFAQTVGTEGAAITLSTGPHDRALLCSTDVLAERIEDTQDLLREGPSLDAQRARRRVGPLSHAEQSLRWPGLTRALGVWDESARRTRTPVLTSFPMIADDQVLGVLMTYHALPEDLSITAAEAQVVVDNIGIVIAGTLRPEALGPESGMVRDRVSQATGMVVAQLGIPPEDALAVLRAHAFAQDVALSEVSGAVLDRRLDFARDLRDQNP